MTTAGPSLGSLGDGGFHKWVKLSTDDLPLIRPPRHHMLAHVTGGLTGLYDTVKLTKKEDEPELGLNSDEVKKDEDMPNEHDSDEGKTKNGYAENNGECDDEGFEEKEKLDEDDKDNKESETKSEEQESEKKEQKSADENNENSQNEKKDDEGGGDEDKKVKDSKQENNIKEEAEDEEEETTPYTDEEGEFSPEKGMPPLAGRYKYAQILARGQSAIIIKVLDTFHKDRPLAIKVLHRVYKPIGSQEADILLELHRADPWLHVPFARLLNQFLYGPHYCLVFDYLSPTPLYTHYDQRDIREATALPHIRDLTVKLLTVLGFLFKQNVIHADLKPENILLKSEDDLSSLMVVDFGNALRNTDEELSLYYSDFELQTLLYRAPEVIFGMKFSLEVDMWSLGCLLAECYLGEPLFMGKSKKEILNKITSLLGPFPKEFNDGEYAEEFADFIGRPMSRYQRVENLRKRLNDCKDSTFLMLVERLLTYLPDRRFTPFEAACHPFVACSMPFLYLTPSPGFIRYPTILLDMSTYPYLPGLPDDEDEDSASAKGRKRLASFARHKKPAPAVGQNQGQGNAHGQKEKDGQGSGNNAVNAGQGGNVGTGGKTATRSDVKETLKSMGLRCEDFTISVYSREQAHAILRRQGVEVTSNNLPGKEKVPQTAGKGGYRNTKSHDFQNAPVPRAPIPRAPIPRAPMQRGVPRAPMQRAPMQRAPMQRAPFPRAPHNMRAVNMARTQYTKTHYNNDDDDDDCVILDPPDMPKPSPRLPQQFQLMGTTVQINRGAKRANRPMYQPQAKRSNARPVQYYRKEDDEYCSEASVQDTLRRLKNYNISITCRRNASGMRPEGDMEGESYMENDDHMDSDEEEEDMTKYLECQIGEVEDMPEEEIFDEDIEVDCDDKDDVDYHPRGKKRRNKSKSPRKGKRPASHKQANVVNLNSSGELVSSGDMGDITHNIEMSELSSDKQDSENEDNLLDPLSEGQDDNELRDMLENAAQIQEEGEFDDQHFNSEENYEGDNPEGAEEQALEEEHFCENVEVGDANVDFQNDEKEHEEDERLQQDQEQQHFQQEQQHLEEGEDGEELDNANRDESGNMMEEYVEDERDETSALAPENSAVPEDEEIDEELEKELLGEEETEEAQEGDNLMEDEEEL